MAHTRTLVMALVACLAGEPSGQCTGLCVAHGMQPCPTCTSCTVTACSLDTRPSRPLALQSPAAP
jgi:hypothetical protein